MIQLIYILQAGFDKHQIEIGFAYAIVSWRDSGLKDKPGRWIAEEVYRDGKHLTGYINGPVAGSRSSDAVIVSESCWAFVSNDVAKHYQTIKEKS